MSKKDFTKHIPRYLELTKIITHSSSEYKKEIPPELADEALAKVDQIMEAYQNKDINFQTIFNAVMAVYKKALKDRDLTLTIVATNDMQTLMKLVEWVYGRSRKNRQ